MYKIVYNRAYSISNAISAVEEEVNKFEKQGWSTQGNLSVYCRKVGTITEYVVCKEITKKEED